ncbi:MAG: LCP family protein [Eubacteriales bacterium]
MNGKRITVLIVSIVFTAVFVFVGVRYYRIREAMSNPMGVFVLDDIVVPDAVESGGDTAIHEVDLVYNQKSYVKKDNILNIVILGRDATPKSGKYADTRPDGGNTDIMIVMAINLEDGSVRAISIPRDSIAHIYHYYDTKDEVNREYFDKLNSAYGAGPRDLDDVQLRNSKTCIQEYLNVFGTFDIEINNYIEVGLTGLMKLTDMVDGVEVTLSNYIPEVGSAGETVTLNAYTAMRYVRDRHNSGGDLGRVSNAKTYIKALARKIQKMGVTSIGYDIAKEMIGDNLMHTDLTLEEIASLASILVNTDVSAMDMQTVPVIDKEDIGGFKKYLANYDYDYDTFYASIGAEDYDDLDIQADDYYDYGFFTEYEGLEEIMLDVYYDELVLE